MRIVAAARNGVSTELFYGSSDRHSSFRRRRKSETIPLIAGQIGRPSRCRQSSEVVPKIVSLTGAAR
jgi:hypothetical protein